MNDDFDAGRCRGRERSRRAYALGIAAGIVVLATACGSSATAGSGSAGSGSSGSSGSSSSSGGGTQAQLDLAYAQCMRAHGVSNFPDPNPDGGFGGSTSSSVRSNPEFGSAQSACRHLLPGGGSQNKVQQNSSAFLQHAQCMRAHGVPNYPDPQPGVNPRTALQQAGINVNSPQVESASQACDHLLPQLGSSPSPGSKS